MNQWHIQLNKLIIANAPVPAFPATFLIIFFVLIALLLIPDATLTLLHSAL